MSTLKPTQTIELFKRDADKIAERAADDVRQLVATAVEAMQSALRAASALPERAMDLVADATAVFVKEFDARDAARVHDVSLRMNTGYCVSVYNDDASYTTGPEIPPGKYRALVFIVPVKEG